MIDLLIKLRVYQFLNLKFSPGIKLKLLLVSTYNWSNRLLHSLRQHIECLSKTIWHQMLQHSLRWLKQLLSSFILVPGLKFIEVVLVFWLEGCFNNCKSISIPTCLHFNSRILGLDVFCVLIQTLPQSFVEVVFFFEETLRCVHYFDGFHNVGKFAFINTALVGTHLLVLCRFNLLLK